jgi:hypothetical protein
MIPLEWSHSASPSITEDFIQEHTFQLPEIGAA